MSSVKETTHSYLERAFVGCVYGAARDTSVRFVIHPLGVLGTLQQCNKNQSLPQIAGTLFKTEGIRGYYRGFLPQIGQTSLQQVWRWPILTTVPEFLTQHQVNEYAALALSGGLIATVDTATTPFEKAKKQAAHTGEKRSWSVLSKEAWKGSLSHWNKLSLNWIAFLTTQKCLRDGYHQEHPNETLTTPVLTGIGVQTAILVSVVGAPLDFINTIKLTKKVSFKELLRTNNLRDFYRGLPIRTSSLVIHCIFSVAVLDKIDKKLNLE